MSSNSPALTQSACGGYNSVRPSDFRKSSVDGFKFFFDKGEWIMIRPSGTEPVLRVYCEAESYSGVDKLLSAAKETILS